MDKYYNCLRNLLDKGNPQLYSSISKESFINDRSDELWETNYSFEKAYTWEEVELFGQIRMLWNHMKGLGDVYDDTLRESFLPTYLYTF